MKRSTSGVRRSKVKVVRAEHRYGGVVEASFSTISGLVGTLFECFSNSRLGHGVKHRMQHHWRFQGGGRVQGGDRLL